jgi:hypothetical protein
MSVANFGPTFPVVAISNALVARIQIPTTAAGSALVNVNLIQTAAGVEIPLVLGPGVWVLRSRCFFEPLAAGAMGVQYAQAYIENLTTNDIIASSSAITGAAYAAGQDNVNVVLTCDAIVTNAVATSFALRFRSNGITTQNGRMGAIGGAGNSILRATELSID